MSTLDASALGPLLAAVIVLPLLGAVAALLPAPPGLRGTSPDQAVLRHGVTVTGAVLLGVLVLAAAFDHDDPATVQARTDLDWIPALGVRLHLGVDGISLPLLVLTALLTFLCALYSYLRPPAGPSAKAFVALLLVLETGTLATFAALDLILFFLAFETVLIPMYFLIARWGGGDRDGAGRTAAAWRFLLYTVLGSVVMLLGFLLLGTQAGTFDMVALAEARGDGLSHTVQLLAVLAIVVGLAVKAPVWPLHGWLPDAHTAAPTAGSVLLAGVLLKMGTYGLVRVAVPVAPDGMAHVAPYLGAFAVLGIVYGSLACLALVREGAAGDLKRLIAYSSVGHMGFVLLGIATLTRTGVNGALFANVAHGLITGLLFFLVGMVRERTGSTDLDRLGAGGGGALHGRAPRLGALLAFAAVASLGLPGLAGFWGELLAMLGAFHPADGLHRPTYLVYLAVAAFGTLLTAAYLLLVVRRVCMGPGPEPSPAEPGAGAVTGTGGRPGGPGAVDGGDGAGAVDGADGAGGADAGFGTTGSGATASEAPVAAPEPGAAVAPRPPLADLHGRDLAVTVPLAALTLLAGLWPALLLHLTHPAVQNLLPGVAR